MTYVKGESGVGYFLAAFRSRTQTMRFFERMKRGGCAVSVVNTPKEAHVGCGISVKLSAQCFGFAKRVLSAGGYDSFAGFFEIRQIGGRTRVKTL